MDRTLFKATILALLILGSMTIATSLARADGYVFSKTAAKVESSTPLQEAAIIHDGAKEHLILSVNFAGEGAEFAWVVPTPSLPEVSLAAPGMISYLAHAAEPKGIPSMFGGMFTAVVIPLVIGFLYLVSLADAKKSGLISVFKVLLVLFVLLITAALLIPAFLRFSAKSGGGATTMVAGVTVHASKSLGNYETTTLSAQDPAALSKWLTENGYRIPPNAAEVIKFYVDKGWYFCAIKLKDNSGALSAGSEYGQTPPLAFTFDSKDIVFPLKITAIGQKESTVLLYVLSDNFARAKKFKIMFADTIGFLPARLRQALSGRINLENAHQLTALWATLKPAQMDDLVLRPDPGIKPQRLTVYSREAKINTLVTLALSAALLIGVLAPKGHVPRKVIFALLIFAGITLGSYPLSLFSSSPFAYRDGRSASGGEARTNLSAIYITEQSYFGEFNTYGQTFSQINWAPEGHPRYTYVLSRDEVFPKDSPYLYAVDETFVYDPPSATGFTAMAIGNLDHDDTLDVWTINDQKELGNIVNDVMQ